MKTDELINTLVADERVEASPGRILWRSLLAPIALAAIVLLATAGIRADFVVAIETPRLLFKLVLVSTLVVAACGTLVRVSRPDTRAGGWAAMLVVVLALLLAGVGVELWTLPSGIWSARLRGANATWCLRMIPMLSALPLAACLFALRRAAPDNGLLAGAAAGLFAAAVGACLYALHCNDDSPLFVATWYGLAVLVVTSIGAAIGARLLRW